MPVQVISPSKARELISRGYRRQPPVPTEDTPESTPAIVDQDSEPQAEDLLNVNTATLSQLIELEGVGVAIAKKIQAKQGSIKTIEDLIQISDRPDWQKLEQSLSFS